MKAFSIIAPLQNAEFGEHRLQADDPVYNDRTVMTTVGEQDSRKRNLDGRGEVLR